MIPGSVSGARAAVGFDGNIHIVGGVDPATHLVYDIDTNTYEPGETLPVDLQRQWSSGGSLPTVDGFAYLVGGNQQDGTTVETSVGRLDLLNGGFEVLSPPSSAPSFDSGSEASLAMLTHDGVIHFTNTSDKLHRFDTSNNDWLPPVELGRTNSHRWSTSPGTTLALSLDGSVLGYNTLINTFFSAGVVTPTVSSWEGMLMFEGDLLAWAHDGAATSFYTSTISTAQRDLDLDGLGDSCDVDRDGDTVVNSEDNCPDVANTGQMDTYGDEQGDVCENASQFPELTITSSDMTTYANSVQTVSFSVEDDCIFSPVISPTSAVRTSVQRVGDRVTSQYQLDINTQGVTSTIIRVDSRCHAGQLESATVKTAIDTTPPVMTFSIQELGVSSPTPAGTPESEYPTIARGNVLTFSSTALDTISGLSKIGASINNVVLIDNTPASSTQGGVVVGDQSPVSVSCDQMSSLCLENELLTSEFELGAHCITVVAEDEAGNAFIGDYCFKLIEGGDLNDSGVLAACSALSAVADTAASSGNLVVSEFDGAEALCAGVSVCVNSVSADLDYMGCVVKGTAGVIKRLSNTLIDLDPSAGVHSSVTALRTQFVNLLSDMVTYYQLTAPMIDDDSVVLAQAFINDAAAAVSSSAKVTALSEAFFWLQNANDPASKLGPDASGCSELASLREKLVAYQNLSPTPPGAAALDQIVNQLEAVEGYLCGVADTEACYSVSGLKGLQALSSLASDMNGLDDSESPGFLIWDNNYKFVLARVAQARVTQALENAESWLVSGEVSGNFTQLLSDANSRWTNIESMLEDDRDLDGFLEEFLSTSSKCQMFFLFEGVNAWWNDASDVACEAIVVDGEALVPLTLPSACYSPMTGFDESSCGTSGGNWSSSESACMMNIWPIHGVSETSPN